MLFRFEISGGDWGSQHLNAGFKDLLNFVFGDEIIRECANDQNFKNAWFRQIQTKFDEDKQRIGKRKNDAKTFSIKFEAGVALKFQKHFTHENKAKWEQKVAHEFKWVQCDIRTQ